VLTAIRQERTTEKMALGSRFESWTPSKEGMKMWTDRRTFICIPCRFTSKYAGLCPLCSDGLWALWNFEPPRKKDDRGWKKIELEILIQNSNIQLCAWTCCVPLRRPRGRNIFGNDKELTLSELKARIRKQQEHRKDVVPQYYGYRGHR
jgi:hypothetical protein